MADGNETHTTTVYGTYVTGNGRMDIVGDVTINPSVTNTTNVSESLTPRQEQVLRNLVGAMRAAGLERDDTLREALHELAEAVRAGRAERSSVHRWVAHVRANAGTADAVIGAAQLAVAAFGG